MPQKRQINTGISDLYPLVKGRTVLTSVWNFQDLTSIIGFIEICLLMLQFDLFYRLTAQWFDYSRKVSTNIDVSALIIKGGSRGVAHVSISPRWSVK